MSFITKYIDRFPVKNPHNKPWLSLLSSFLMIGVPSYLLFFGHVILRHHLIRIPHFDLARIFVALNWAWIGSFLIWCYEKRTQPALMESLPRLCIPCSAPDSFRKIGGSLASSLKGVSLSWTLFVLVGYYFSKPYVLKIGFNDQIDYWYILSYMTIALLAFMSSLGFVGVIRVDQVAYKIYRHTNLQLYCYHPDKTGGLSPLINFTKKTTYIFASGTIFFPILISVASSLLAASRAWIYCLMTCYSAFIMLSYIFPNYLIYKKAKQEKDRLLKDASEKIAAILQKAENGAIGYRDYFSYFSYRNLWMDIKECPISPFSRRHIEFVIAVGMVPVVATLCRFALDRYLGK